MKELINSKRSKEVKPRGCGVMDLLLFFIQYYGRK